MALKVRACSAYVCIIGVFYFYPINTRAEDFLSCTSLSYPSDSSYYSGSISTHFHKTPLFNEPKVENPLAVFKPILHRLIGDDIHAFLGFEPIFKLYYSPIPNAYSSLPQTISVSSSLIEQVKEPSQLAFVVAHEISHLLSHKQKKVGFLGPFSDINHQTEEELKADLFALELLKSSGFEPQSGIILLESLSRLRDSPIHLPDYYPSIELRLKTLRIQLASNDQK